jgi:hypothetical protein
VVAVYQRMPAGLTPHRASISSRFGQVRLGAAPALAAWDADDAPRHGEGVPQRRLRLQLEVTVASLAAAVERSARRLVADPRCAELLQRIVAGDSAPP